MPAPYCVDDFKDKFDSLYRLVIVAASRVVHLSKNDPRGFGSALRGQKNTIKALEEVLDGKLTYINAEEEIYLEDEE
ncbi:MAG: DNA-directed RNA polymerase subunit omega [Candidatus Hydrogenedentes bacterium]|jgi:DNA-directed RNA polymerase omega subunit|nr:DNA-directed RNA polymerase subunit omega [Candidatus Hydrogenedentota bacterium]